jgi:ubiquinol-cytochrome c reductase subunit 7
MSFIGATARALRVAARPSTTIASRSFVNSAAVKKWAFNASGFNQYGLYHDDAMYESPDVKEALTRVPQNILDERSFRIQRAMQCSVMKTVLPKDQWPSFEEDREHGRYLQPYLHEVVKERTEREAWAKQG